MPLIVLTSDRPPELRGIGAGQTIDQLKLYGVGGAVVLRGRHPRGRRHRPAPHALGGVPRAMPPRGASRARARCTSTSPWREPLGPEPRDGDVTASSGSRSRDGAAAADRRRPAGGVATPDAAQLDELAAAHRDAPARPDRVRSPAATPTRSRCASPASPTTGYPILAEPTSQLRLGGTTASSSCGPYDAIARRARPDLAPELVVRFGDMPTSKPLRQWLASIDELHEVVIDPLGRLERPQRARGDAAARRPGRRRRRLCRAARAARERRLDRGVEGRGGGGAEAIDGALDELATGRPSPASTRALGRLYADGDLVYTASSMPIRDQEAFVARGPAPRAVPVQPGRERDRRARLVGDRRRGGERPADLARPRRPGLYHDMNGLSALRGVDAPVRSWSSTTAAAGSSSSCPRRS